MAALGRCAHPTITSRQWSTYTVLGFIGYGAASLVAVALARAWDLSLAERLVTCFAPPLAFVAVVAVSMAITGRERIVFYQTACTSVAATAVAARLAGARVTVALDVVAIGVGVFLVFGRIGCFSVACCHGRLGPGVTYGRAHVAAGFWSRWEGRSLLPVQLVEAFVSLVAVVVALRLRARPGDAAIAFIDFYALARFALELFRGDSARPYWLGVSEAQCASLAAALACAIWRPTSVTSAVAGSLAVGVAVLVAKRRTRELLLPPHVRALDAALASRSDGERRDTYLGVSVSRHALPDGRIDWILSSSHAAWSGRAVRVLATALWARHEIVAGSTPGVFHVIVDPHE